MNNNTERGLPPSEWERYFSIAKIKAEQLAACKSARSKAVTIGQFLSPLIGREVPIEVKGRTGTAALRVTEGRGRQKQYHFEVRWDKTPEPSAGLDAEAAATPTKMKVTEPAVTVVTKAQDHAIAVVHSGPVDSTSATSSKPVATTPTDGTGNNEAW